MGSTKIPWANKVWNPITGCTKVSEGCRNCYAERMATRLKGRCGYPEDDPFRVTLHPEKLREPMKWQKPQRVFVNSMSDLFHEEVPFYEISKIWNVMRRCREFGHIFLVLTKRPKRIIEFFEWWENNHYSCPKIPLPNVWLGVTAENQEMADLRIPILLQIPAAVRFVSVEPMLGPLDLDSYLIVGADQPDSIMRKGLDWVICGGESGPNARPMHPDWVRSLREQCQAAGVPFFFKQWGEWIEDDNDLFLSKKLPSNKRLLLNNGKGRYVPMARIGKHQTGDILDGQELKEFPEIIL